MKEDGCDLFYRFTAWMKLVVKRAKIDYIRRNKHRQSECSIEDDTIKNTLHYEHDYGTTPTVNSFDFDNDLLRKAFAKLSPQRRRVLIMLFIKKMSAEEITDELNCDVRNVINLRYYALRDLRSMLYTKEN